MRASYRVLLPKKESNGRWWRLKQKIASLAERFCSSRQWIDSVVSH